MSKPMIVKFLYRFPSRSFGGWLAPPTSPLLVNRVLSLKSSKPKERSLCFAWEAPLLSENDLETMEKMKNNFKLSYSYVPYDSLTFSTNKILKQKWRLTPLYYPSTAFYFFFKKPVSRTEKRRLREEKEEKNKIIIKIVKTRPNGGTLSGCL